MRKDNPVDIVVCWWTFSYLDEYGLSRVLDGILRVLKKDGFIIGAEPILGE
jgi:hypothetical protein